MFNKNSLPNSNLNAANQQMGFIPMQTSPPQFTQAIPMQNNIAQTPSFQQQLPQLNYTNNLSSNINQAMQKPFQMPLNSQNISNNISNVQQQQALPQSLFTSSNNVLNYNAFVQQHQQIFVPQMQSNQSTNTSSHPNIFPIRNSFPPSTPSSILQKYNNERISEDIIKRNTEPARMEIEEEEFNYEKNLKMSIDAPIKAFRNNLNEKSFSFPLKISLNALESKDVNDDLFNRPAIDLICVVDISGSMSGEKINLVKKTLDYIISLLNQQDRLALIVFDDQSEKYFDLKQVSQSNKPMFQEIIGVLQGRGGTVINSGLSFGLDLIKQRKYINQVTSLFLLSDGYDNIGQKALDVIKNTIETIKIKENFTIHTFGFGESHDAVLMREIAKTQGGNFYFIPDLKSIDECFIDALGLLFSVVMKDIEICIKVNNTAPLTDMRIKKTYGDVWRFDEQTQTNIISLKVLAKGMKKDLICELNIPTIKKPLQDNEKDRLILRAKLVGSSLKNQKIEKQEEFHLKLLNHDEPQQNIESELNLEVIVHHLRVKGAAVIETGRQLANQRAFKEAENLFDQILKDLDACPCKDHPTLIVLRSDLENSKKVCLETNYNIQAVGQLSSLSYNNMCQQSCPMSKVGNINNLYSNCMQAKMSNNLKQNKK